MSASTAPSPTRGNGGYSYTLNNANARCRGWTVGQTLTETFSYTMQDADGDTDTAMLTITINGANDAPTVTVDTGNPLNANDLVHEAGLAAGSDAASTSEFATGTFTLADPDGLDDLVSVTIDGFGAPVTFTVAQLGLATPARR